MLGFIKSNLSQLHRRGTAHDDIKNHPLVDLKPLEQRGLIVGIRPPESLEAILQLSVGTASQQPVVP